MPATLGQDGQDSYAMHAATRTCATLCMLQVATDNRTLTAASGLFLILALSSWISNRSGFAGYLDPEATLKLLKNRNACLIDLR